MESAEYPHTMGPTLGANFLSQVLPSPSLGDGSSTGSMALWMDNSEMAAVVEVVFIYTRADLEETPNTITKGKKERDGRKWNSVQRTLQYTRTILNMYKQWMQNWSCLSTILKVHIRLQTGTSQIISVTILEALLRTKWKYIQLRKIEVQNGIN